MGGSSGSRADASSRSVSTEGFDPGRKVDWIDEGRKHFVATKTHPERPCQNYPTQDVHTAKDEADFILGFKAAKAAWERGEGLSGTEAYAAEHDEARKARGQ
jgi:hypothetical protein